MRFNSLDSILCMTDLEGAWFITWNTREYCIMKYTHADNSHPASHRPHKISNSTKIFPDPYSCLNLHKYKTASGGSSNSNPQAEEQIPKCINRAVQLLSEWILLLKSQELENLYITSLKTSAINQMQHLSRRRSSLHTSYYYLRHSSAYYTTTKTTTLQSSLALLLTVTTTTTTTLGAVFDAVVVVVV